MEGVGGNASFYFSCWIFLKKGEFLNVNLTINCEEKTHHFPFDQSSRLQPHFHSHFQGASCYQGLSLWGFFSVRFSQFSPIRLRIYFSQYLSICLVAPQILLPLFSFILFILTSLCLKIMTKATNLFFVFIWNFGKEWIEWFIFKPAIFKQ